MTNSAKFPSDFQWGVATSSYQIEGGVDQGGRGESIWDRFSHTEGKTYQGQTGDVACDHYRRFPEDIALMKHLGLSSYRFSAAWVRVIPDGGKTVNPAGLDFYDRVVDELLATGIRPWLTLYHWDLPQALEEKGGWLNRDTSMAFAEYATALADRLGDRVKNWLTLNEPWVSTYLGYVWGGHAPGRTGNDNIAPVAHHLLLAHGLATERIRAAAPDSRVGIALDMSPMYPRSLHPADVAEARSADTMQNAWFADPLVGRGYPEAGVKELKWDQQEVKEGDMAAIAAPLDMLGINYYSREVVASEKITDQERPDPVTNNENSPYTEMGWEVFSPGLYTLLTDIHLRYGFPEIYITENGCAFNDPPPNNGQVEDPDRVSYLRGHLLALHRAMGEGVPVRGYFLWTLMDNFEWAYGFSKRFGLYQMNPDTLERVPKTSADWYRQVIEKGAVG